MLAIIILAAIVAVYFFLKQFDPKKETPFTVSDASPSEQKETQRKESKELKFFCVKDKGYHVSVWPNVDGYSGLDYIEFDIAGITYHKEAAIQHLGETLGFLAAEPDNPYDSNAIRVMTPDWQCVGYVPRDMTAQIREHTKLPCPCFFYIGLRHENGDQIFYTDAYIKLDLINKNQVNN